MKKILIIEDDRVLSEELSRLLQSAGYEAVRITEFSDVAAQMHKADANLILLDINLPGISGETLLQEFRRKSNTPVIMLTSRTGEIDEVLSMSCGADDYITKPYHPTILLLRISAVLKRAGSAGSAGKEQILTKNEMIIFQLLLERRGEIVTRDDLMTALWDNDEFVNDNALSVNISRLRGKLAELGFPDAIETRKKQGYVLK